ncbi:MAG TPA: GAF domain-containing protein [Gaiellaceae bacterium]|nr:GAF domain-containing protein [Gaiellaceae bacterium]
MNTVVAHVTPRTPLHRALAVELGPRTGTAARRYLVALAATALGIGASILVMQASDIAIFSPILAAAAVAVWYGGLGPGVVSVAIGWAAGLAVLSEPWFSFSVDDREQTLGWIVALLSALIVVGVATAMRRGQERAATVADETERSERRMERLQELASELSAAATRSQVARALVDGTSQLLGARGGSVGLIDGEVLEIIDPLGAERQTLEPGLRLPLKTAAPIAASARTGKANWVADRAAFEREFPDGARLAPYAAGALAVPIRVGDRVIGSMGFPFVSTEGVDEGDRAAAQIAADLGGQALERSGLYEAEREWRAGLDRVLRVAPRFQAGSTPRDVVVEVCREARATFGADVAQIWTARDPGDLEVVWRDPPSAGSPPGAHYAADDFPGLRAALTGLRTMFIGDSLAQVRGRGLEDARAQGIRSSFRVPIAIGGRAERVLVLQWHTLVSEPEPGVAALARRFADQAGLAIEQAERRLAERDAARSADETRRLLDVTAALAAAATRSEVAAAIVSEACRNLSADGGVVVLGAEDDESMLEVVQAAGFGELIGSPLRRFSRFARLPLADAVRRDELIVLESLEERDRRYPELRGHEGTGHGAWLAVPIALGGRAVGALGLGFASGRSFPESDLDFANALARQAAQALERARLLDAEHVARSRAERTAGNLAQLHALGTALARARSAVEVAEAVGSQLVGALGARAAAVFALGEEAGPLELLGGTGLPTEGLADGDGLAALAVREGEPAWVDGGTRTLAAVPMVSADRAIGAVVVEFDGGPPLDDNQRRLVETVGRQAAEPLARVQLLESERASRRVAERATERTRRLQSIAEALAAAATSADVAETAIREVMAALEADSAFCYVMVGGDQLELLATQGYPDERLDPWRLLPVDAPVPVCEAARTGELIALRNRDEIVSRYPVLERSLRGSEGERAGVCVPVRLGTRTLGVIYVSFTTDRALEHEDLAVVRAVAGQCAVALERARLFELEQAAAERIRRLQEVTAALSQAATPREVSATSLELAAAAFGAHGGVVAVLAPEGDALEVVWSLGYSEAELADWQRIPLDAEVPVAQAVRNGDPIWAIGDEAVAAYEPFATAAGSAGDRAWAALPLMAGAVPRGALQLSFSEPREFSPEDRDWLAALAGQCAQALDRSRLYDDERRSRRRSERLQAMTAALTGSLAQREVASVLLDQSLAAFDVDLGVVALYRPDTNELESVEFRGADEDQLAPWRRYSVGAEYPSADAFRQRRTLVLDHDAYVDSYPELGPPFAQLGIETIAYFPLFAGGRGMGVAVFGWRTARVLEADELAFFETLASQCAQALDRARRYESERTIAETLQRSVLPDRLPDVDGLELAGRYLPGTAGVDVGGDWFDVIPLERGRVGLAVGDVVGKGVTAAATMGQLRNGLRAFALEQLRPSSAVTRLNRLLDSVSDAPFATLAYLTVDPRRGICRYTVAGHPPPLLALPDGTVEFLDGARSLPLGVGADVQFQQDVLQLEPGAVVVLYTDGLVERRDSSLDDGLERLRDAVARAPRDPEQLVEAVIADCLGDQDRGDDVAVLVMRLSERPVADLELRLPADPASLVVVRAELREWLALTPATEAEASDVVLAAWEACANAVEHAQLPNASTFALEASSIGRSVFLRVRDSGRWRTEEERPDRGLGLVLMRSLMDRLQVVPGERGTVVTMERRVGAEA